MSEPQVSTATVSQDRLEHLTGMTPEQELRCAELLVDAFLDPAEDICAVGDPLELTREDFTGLGEAGACLLTMCWEPAVTTPAAGAVALGA